MVHKSQIQANNPFFAALRSQELATSEVADANDRLVTSLGGIAEAISSLPADPVGKEVGLAIVLFERSGDITTTTEVGKWFEETCARFLKNLGSRKKLGIGQIRSVDDLVPFAEDPTFRDARASLVRMLAAAAAPAKLIEDMGPTNFDRLIAMAPQVRDWLQQAAPYTNSPPAAGSPAQEPKSDI